MTYIQHANVTNAKGSYVNSVKDETEEILTPKKLRAEIRLPFKANEMSNCHVRNKVPRY